MYKYLILLPLFLMFIESKSQELNSSFCQTNFSWDNIELCNDELSKTCNEILIVSNREFDTNNTNKLLPNKLAKNNAMNYLVAGCSKGKWILRRVKDFETGMNAIDDNKHIVAFVHGNGKTLPMALTRAHRIQTKYKVTVILFDWPSKNNTISKSVRMVRKCEPNFVKFLENLKAYKNSSMEPGQNLSLIAHSLGNYYIEQMVRTGNILNQKEKFIDNLILNAPAIKAKNHAEIISKLHFQKNIYIVLNKNDFVLRGAQMITARRLLGNLILKNPSKSAKYIHFTNVAGKEHTYFAGFHEFEFTNPAIIDFYTNALHGKEVNLEDKTYYKFRKQLDGYELKYITTNQNN